MDKKNRKGRSWLVWNLANIITTTGFVGAYWILFYTSWGIPWKFAGYIATEAIDALDGPVARWLGNTDGIGKVLDPTADKLKKFFVLYFMFQNTDLAFRLVVGLILLGEIAVLILVGGAVYLVYEYERDHHLKSGGRLNREGYKTIFKNMASEVMKNWRVCQEGKLTMVCYVALFVAILLRSIWMDMDIFTYLYVSFAIIGFIFRSLSFVYYWKKLLAWQDKASAKAKGAG